MYLNQNVFIFFYQFVLSCLGIFRIREVEAEVGYIIIIDHSVCIACFTALIQFYFRYEGISVIYTIYISFEQLLHSVK